MTFEAAQAAWDNAQPADPPIFRCVISREMNEDCEGCLAGDHDDQDDDLDEEPPDFDDYKNGEGRYAPDYWLEDNYSD